MNLPFGSCPRVIFTSWNNVVSKALFGIHHVQSDPVQVSILHLTKITWKVVVWVSGGNAPSTDTFVSDTQIYVYIDIFIYVNVKIYVLIYKYVCFFWVGGDRVGKTPFVRIWQQKWLEILLNSRVWTVCSYWGGNSFEKPSGQKKDPQKAGTGIPVPACQQTSHVNTTKRCELASF